MKSSGTLTELPTGRGVDEQDIINEEKRNEINNFERIII
jgi:hypothetical protein